MHIHFSAPERYLRADHAIIRHPRLNGTAKTLLLWSLSMRQGHLDTILTIGQRMPEGRQAVSTARAQLVAEGYLHVRRFQHPTKGTWHTDVMVSSVPLTAPEEIAAAWAAARREAEQASPTHQGPTVGGTAVRGVGSSPLSDNPIGENHPPGEPDPELETELETVPDPEEPEPEPAESAGLIAAAGRVLSRLLAREARLALGVGEILSLAPLAAEWLARDRSEARLGRALLDGLPRGRIFAPVAFLRGRLERKMPFPREDTPPPLPLRECADCQGPVRDGEACGACAAQAGRVDPQAAERTRRGAAAARAAMAGVRDGRLGGGGRLGSGRLGGGGRLGAARGPVTVGALCG